MAVKNVDWRLNLGSAITDRLPSPAVWGDCPWDQLQAGIVSGVWFEDNFMSFPKTPPTTEGNWGQYAVFSSTGGAIVNHGTTSQGGEIKISSDDDNEGVGIRTLATPFKIIRNGSLGRLWFEARVKVSTIANTTFEMFLGLMEDAALTATVPITATAATLADQNLVGFYRTESAGSTANTTYKANGVTAVTVGSAEITLVADTYIKLGMKYEPVEDPFVGTKFLLSFYVNNQRLASTKQIPSAAGTDFPNDVSLGLVWAVRNAAGSSPGTATLDWWRAAQLI